MRTRSRRLNFDHLLQRSSLRPAYQPIVDLDSQEMVAAEALARWPGIGIAPDEAFQLATSQGRLRELDEACRFAAVDDAVAHGLPSGFSLFVNLEPSVLGPETASRLLAHALGQIELVIEITERALLHRPAELLRAIEELRSAGCAIALDDVGAEPESLALLPFVAPDVVKLDISLVQSRPNSEQAAVLSSVAAYAENSGATILAEGIETEAHLDQALALGATLGQGWFFARPGPLGDVAQPPTALLRRSPLAATPGTPCQGIYGSDFRVGRKGLLLSISHHLESKGLTLDIPPVVVGAFQDAERFTPATSIRYAALADRCSLVAALGVGLASEPVPGVRGVALPDDDPLRGEWVVAVVGAHYTGALIARDLGDDGPDRDRRFAFVLTHDRETVMVAARSLLARVEPQALRSSLSRGRVPATLGAAST
jgi:EAL domain-containing protein (putative c-di-GMP-specific phosphodiesterase class I)